MELISVPISLFSLGISLGTFWLAFVKRGRLAMTKPTILFFGYDTVPKPTPKVFLRTLLYSTSVRGQVVEGMFVKLRRGSEDRVFSFWGYGEAGKLMAGSGLHVSQTGVAANHHFVLSVHEGSYQFEPGRYDIDVFADVVGRKHPVLLSSIHLTLSPDLAATLANHDGVLFERGISGEYEGHAR